MTTLKAIKPETVVLIRVKEVYGRTLIYPANDTAATFATIAGTKTLDSRVLAIIKQLGFTVQVETPEVKGI